MLSYGLVKIIDYILYIIYYILYILDVIRRIQNAADWNIALNEKTFSVSRSIWAYDEQIIANRLEILSITSNIGLIKIFKAIKGVYESQFKGVRITIKNMKEMLQGRFGKIKCIRLAVDRSTREVLGILYIDRENHIWGFDSNPVLPTWINTIEIVTPGHMVQNFIPKENPNFGFYKSISRTLSGILNSLQIS